MPVNRITKFTFNGDLDFRNKIMSLDTAKHILAHLSSVTGKTIQLSNDMWALIEDDDEAIEILEEAYSRGWNSNEPDIIITAASGYNGIVKVNGSDFQLTETSTGSGVWINSSTVTITSLASFLERDSRHALNNTAEYIKTVRFGKNANTSSCTTLFRFASSYTTNTALLSKLDLRHLDTSSVTIMQGAFSGISEGSVEHIGIEDFDVSNVTDFRYCFNGALALGDLDLHKWHTASGGYTGSFLTSAQACAETGVNQKIYYTPGYWGLELLDTSYQQLTVYPYHDITVASSLTSGQKIYINGSSQNMSYDSSLKIWYYDIEGTVDTMESMFRQDSSYNPTASSVISVSFGSNIASKINYANVSSDAFLFAWKATATNIRSVDFTSLAKALNDNLNIVPIRQMFIYNAQESGHGTNLVNIYGLDQITKQIDVGHSFRGCESLRYIDLGTTDYASNGFKRSFYYNTNLIRIKNLPGIPSGCNTTNVFTSCSSLTTIDASGPIEETIDFSPCPLNLASAKVILSALQTVTSETISFSTATWMAINDDEEAVELLEEAYSKGWNSNEPDIVVIHDGAWSRKLRINNADVTISQYDSTHAYYSTINSSITTLIGMCKKVSGVTNYWDSTSTNIRYVRFGKNAYSHTANVTNLQQAFAARNTITNLKVDVTHLNTSKVTTFTSMFRTDGTLTGTYYEIKGYENWDTSKATTMNLLFNNKYFKPGICDLHNWTVGSSCNISQMFPGVSDRVGNGNEYPVYFTPSKFKAPTWANNGNVTWKSFSPYPYHKVNVVYNGSEANHNIYDAALGQNVALSYDSTNELYYYDDATTINGMFSSSNNASTSNINFISVKLESGNRNMAHAFDGCSNLVSVDFTMCKNLSGSNSLNSTFYNTSLLQEVNGLNAVVEGSESYDAYYCALGAYNLRWFNPGEWNVAPNSDAKWLFACSSNNPGTLRRIEYWPGIPSSVTNTEQLFLNQSTVTQIIAAGDQYKTLDLSTSPLDISSAKVILRALQTVTSETITFNSSTITAIQADNEAKQLVMLAIEKGWSIPGVSVELPSITNQTLYDIFYSGEPSDNNVGVTINFTLNNPDGYEITECGVCRAETINPSTPTATTTTGDGSKSVDVLDCTYNTTYYFRSYVTFNKYDGTSQTVYADDNVQYTEQYVLSRKSASGTSGTCSVRTNGTSATNIYVNVRCNCYPVDPYNSSNYSLKWELRRSSTTGTLIASGTASYQSGVTAFYTHGNAAMSNANTTKYTHYFVFYRSDDTAHKVYYVSNNTFAEKGTADEWTLFHYAGKSY